MSCGTQGYVRDPQGYVPEIRDEDEMRRDKTRLGWIGLDWILLNDKYL